MQFALQFTLVLFYSFLQMIVVKRVGMAKIIEDMAGHREEVEGGYDMDGRGHMSGYR